MDVSFRIEVETLAGALDQLDYFAVLKLAACGDAGRDPRCLPPRVARSTTPTATPRWTTPSSASRIGRIYRRINEAYTVLRDDARRKKYAGDVAGPDRARKLRFTEADESAVQAAQKKRADEQLGQTPNGRKFYASALVDAQASAGTPPSATSRGRSPTSRATRASRSSSPRPEKHRPKRDYRIK